MDRFHKRVLHTVFYRIRYGKTLVRFVIFLTIRDTDIEMCRIFYSGLCSDNSGTEFIHWIAYKKEGANDVRFGAIWKSFVFYAAAHNFAADYKTFRRIALAPFYILSVLLVLLFLFPVPLWGKISIAAILLFHIVSCSGDLSMLSYMKRYKRRNVITVDDIDNRFTYFMEK